MVPNLVNRDDNFAQRVIEAIDGTSFLIADGFRYGCDDGRACDRYIAQYGKSIRIKMYA